MLTKTDIIQQKLEEISSFWNHYIWEYKFCQSQINFNEETKINYFGDILAYFEDTIKLIKYRPHNNSYQENIFYSIGLLQTIYVQQDLIKELLYIFKLDSNKLSNDSKRNINRDIRNELIGHPIRRTKNEELISSVIFGNKLNNNFIHYIVYPKDSNYNGIEKNHKIEDIINRHEEFLLENLELIDKKITEILKLFLKKIKEIESLIDKQIPIEGLLRVVRNQFEYVYKFNELFVENYLVEMNVKRETQKRYEFGINLFIKELQESIKNTKSEISLTLGLNQDSLDIEETEDPIENNRNYDYELGKLGNRHPIYGPEYFKKIFHNDLEICTELDNMIINNHSDLEYYSSYEYIRYLIKVKTLGMPSEM